VRDCDVINTRGCGFLLVGQTTVQCQRCSIMGQHVNGIQVH
jgi:hypothetical protein